MRKEKVMEGDKIEMAGSERKGRWMHVCERMREREREVERRQDDFTRVVA